MSDFAEAGLDERVLVLVAVSGDATLTRSFLAEAGLTCALCSSIAEMCVELSAGAGAILVNEEALIAGGTAKLAQALRAQPVWSDIPVLLLTSRGADSEAVLRAMTTLPNITVLERPVRVVTLVSALRTALRARRRQYEIRKQVQALAESEASYRAMFDATSVGVIETDVVTGRITRVNAALCRLTGYGEGELVGRSFDELTHPDDLAASREASRRLLKGEIASHEAEYRYVRRDGKTLWAHIAVNVIRDTEGRPRRNTGVILDITERKRAEDALKEADRQKNEFLAILSHELRNPLAPIRNGLELLRLAETNSAAAEQARQIMERQVRHMVRLVDDLVDVARITRGAIMLRKERVDLADVLEHAIEGSRPIIEEAHHQLSVSPPEEALIVDGDPARLSQVLSNLLVNAARYTPLEGRISLAAWREREQAVIAVTDSGIGIPRHMLEKIFDLFTQVDAGISRSQGGLGIGLGLARRIVELHGGTIEVQSAGPGKGSTFTVRLPVAEDKALEAPAPRARAVPSGRPLRVLIVDDERDVATATEMLLRLKGHEVRLAHDGPAALAAAGGAPPDVVLLDLGMPGMDGYAVARALREQRGGADVPIVAVSGFSRDVDVQKSKDFGFIAHLVKPVEPEALERVLASLTVPASESG
jgi:PAS domain S-box-containing protein